MTTKNPQARSDGNAHQTQEHKDLQKALAPSGAPESKKATIKEEKLQKEKLQKNTARLAAFSAFLLAVAKFVIALLTSSMALMASALDSIMDVAASTINYYSIRESLKPADRKHPYGHGKLESLACLLQAQLMITSALYVIYSAYQKVFQETQMRHLNTGIAVMLISTVVSILIYRRLKHVGEKTNSVALRADSLHYGSDALSNLGVMVSLVIVQWTKWAYVDIIVSVFISLYIIYAAALLLKEAVDILMDKTLDNATIEKIHRVIHSFAEVNSYHNLRTRKAGNRLFVEFHAVVSSGLSFQQAHDVVEKLTYAILQAFDEDVEVNIHMDPKDDEEQNKKIMDVGLNSREWEKERKSL